jgi:hypothetical protein
MDGAGRAKPRPGMSKQDVCEWKANPSLPKVRKSWLYKDLQNSHRKNRRYAYLDYAKNYDSWSDKACLWVLRRRRLCAENFICTGGRASFTPAW